MRVLMLGVLAALLLVPSASAWAWPAGGPVLRAFSFSPDNPYAAGQHRGIDVAGASDASVPAPAGGTISFAGTVPNAGKTVTIETQDGYSVTLLHLGSIGVKRDATVYEGEPVGTIGPSGDVELAQPYVYLGIRVTADRQGYVDPLSLLPPRAVSAAPLAPPTATPGDAIAVPAAPLDEAAAAASAAPEMSPPVAGEPAGTATQAASAAASDSAPPASDPEALAVAAVEAPMSAPSAAAPMGPDAGAAAPDPQASVTVASAAAPSVGAASSASDSSTADAEPVPAALPGPSSPSPDRSATDATNAASPPVDPSGGVAQASVATPTDTTSPSPTEAELPAAAPVRSPADPSTAPEEPVDQAERADGAGSTLEASPPAETTRAEPNVVVEPQQTAQNGRANVAASASHEPTLSTTLVPALARGPKGGASLFADQIRPRRAEPRDAAASAPIGRDSGRTPAGERKRHPRPAWLYLLLPVAALGAIVLRRRSTRPPAGTVEAQPAPIMDTDALLPDNADLLRELDTAHRARVHDHHRRHPRATPAPAWGGDLLPDGRGRACRQGGARGRGARAHAARVHRRDRRPLAGAAAARQRVDRLLHQDER